MSTNKDEAVKMGKIMEKAMDAAANVLGVDPAYYGDEGDEEIERQLNKLGYTLEDFKK